MPMADTHDEGYTTPPLNDGDMDVNGFDRLVPDISTMPLLSVDTPVSQRQNGSQVTLSSGGEAQDAPVSDDTDTTTIPRVSRRPVEQPISQPVERPVNQPPAPRPADIRQSDAAPMTRPSMSEDEQQQPSDDRQSLATRNTWEDEDDMVIHTSRQGNEMRLVDREKTLLHMAARKVYNRSKEAIVQLEDIIANQDPAQEDGDFLQRNVAGAELAPFLAKHSTEIYARAFTTEYGMATEDVQILLDQLLHATALNMYREAQEDTDDPDTTEHGATHKE